MTDTVRSYGINEAEPDGGDVGAHAERIRLAGYTVIPPQLTAAATADLGQRLEAVYDRQVEDFGGVERLRSIGDAYTVRCPLVYDDAFLALATQPTVLALARHLLGDYIVLMQQNGILNPPADDHTQAAYHRDLPYQHFVSSRPLAVSALFCIDAFTVDSGATVVVPGSHRVERFASTEAVRSMEVAVTADPASFIVFDAMLFHRAGNNRTDRLRRAVNHVFTVPIIAQQISLPAALQGRHRERPELSRLLGYDSTPPASVEEWRQRRLERQP